MKYQPPFGAVDPNAGYTNGNPVTGAPGSIPPAPAFEQTMREIVNAIMAAGLVPGDSDLTQLTQAIALLGRIPLVTDQGTPGAIVINPAPAVTQYGGSQPKIFAIQIAPGNTNIAPGATINVSGLGNIALTRTSGAPLSIGDLLAGGIILVSEATIASVTTFQLISVPGSLAFPLPQQLWHYGSDIGTLNNIIVNIDNIGASIPTGIPIGIFIAHTNTNATVMATINGFAAVQVTRGNSGALSLGDIASGYIAWVVFDGAELQLINFLNGAAGGAGGNDITGPDRPYWLAGNSATVTAQPGSPSMGDTYLIPAGATGGWSGLAGKLSQWNGTAWVQRSYPVGSLFVASDTNLAYQCTVAGTTWVQVVILTPAQLNFYACL